LWPEDGGRWFTLARTVSPQGGRIGGVRAQFVIGLGLDADLAAPLAAARGIDLKRGEAVPIGAGCRACTRPDCPQRASPPAARKLSLARMPISSSVSRLSETNVGQSTAKRRMPLLASASSHRSVNGWIQLRVRRDWKATLNFSFGIFSLEASERAMKNEWAR
jgi:hypothetical protein